MTAGTCEACGHNGQIYPLIDITTEDSEGNRDSLYRPGDLCEPCWVYARDRIDSALRWRIAIAEQKRGEKQ